MSYNLFRLGQWNLIILNQGSRGVSVMSLQWESLMLEFHVHKLFSLYLLIWFMEDASWEFIQEAYIYNWFTYTVHLDLESLVKFTSENFSLLFCSLFWRLFILSSVIYIRNLSSSVLVKLYSSCPLLLRLAETIKIVNV